MVFVLSVVVSSSLSPVVVVGFVLFVVAERISPLLRLGPLGVVVGVGVGVGSGLGVALGVGVVVGSCGRSETLFGGLLEGPFMIFPPSERMEAEDPVRSE